MSQRCPTCGTEYIHPVKECDWCGIPILTDDCPGRLERAEAKVMELAPKAAKWDMLMLTCHRFGTRCTDIVQRIEEKMRWRQR